MYCRQDSSTTNNLLNDLSLKDTSPSQLYEYDDRGLHQQSCQVHSYRNKIDYLIFSITFPNTSTYYVFALVISLAYNSTNCLTQSTLSSLTSCTIIRFRGVVVSVLAQRSKGPEFKSWQCQFFKKNLKILRIFIAFQQHF